MNKKIKSFCQFNLISTIVLIIGLLLVIPFIFVFVFSLNKAWYDGLSTAGAFYIGVGILCSIFNVWEFHHFQKIKNLFVIKKEKNAHLTTIEKKQMKVLNVKYDDEESIKFKRIKNKKSLRFTYFIFIFIGIIYLTVSLPFLFI